MRYCDIENRIQLQSETTQCRYVELSPCLSKLTAALVRSFSLGMVWSTVELGTAIICGCLPTYRPLLHDSKLPAPVRAWFVSAIHSARGLRSKSTGQSSSQKTYGDSGSGYKKFHDDAHSDDVHSQDTEEGGWTKGAEDGPAHPLKAITVERRVEIV